MAVSQSTAAQTIVPPAVWSREWILSPECGQYLREEQQRIARDLWELRHEWPHRENMRTGRGQ